MKVSSGSSSSGTAIACRLRIIAAVYALAFAQVAAATDLFQETFSNTTLSTPLSWALSFGGTEVYKPCLTAADGSDPFQNLFSGTIGGCASPAIDAVGSGALRLTPAEMDQSGTLLYDTPLPPDGGLTITFKLAEYGGDGADGISFFVKDGSNSSITPGTPGGALGYGIYSAYPGDTGIKGGLFGVGFDAWGNFSNPAADGASCASAAPGNTPNSIAVRGPDTSAGQAGTNGYCYLGGTGSTIDYSGANRTEAARLVKIVVDPATVAPRKINIYFGKVLPATPTLSVDLPTEFINATSFKFGFSASTGASIDNHEIWVLKVSSVIDISTVTVTAASLHMTQGNVPTVGYSSSGFSGSDTFSTLPTCVAYTDSTYLTPVTASTPPGTYVTHCSGAAATGYAMEYVNGVLIIDTPTVTVTADSLRAAQGSVPAVGYTSSGFSGSDTFSTLPTCAAYTDSTYLTPVTASTPPGSYVTHCSGAAASGYAIRYVDGTLVIASTAPKPSPRPMCRLDVAVSGVDGASGVVTSAPKGIDCGADCSGWFPYGGKVYLTAKPQAGSVLQSWTNCDLVLEDQTCLTHCDADIKSPEVIANFRLVATPAPTATPAPASSPAPTATPAPAPTPSPSVKQVALTVVRVGAGAVASSTDGIACGSICSAEYAVDSAVTLTATPAEGYKFKRWVGAGCSGRNPCTVKLNRNKTVKAKFVKQKP